MAGDKKIVAVVVLCMVVLSALAVPKVEADGEYKACNAKCKEECKNKGSEETMCEMECNTKCGANVVKDKFKGIMD